jgi:hypothetical protein
MWPFPALRKGIKLATKKMKNRQEARVGVFSEGSGHLLKTKRPHFQRKHRLKRMIKCSSIERSLGFKEIQQQLM